MCDSPIMNLSLLWICARWPPGGHGAWLSAPISVIYFRRHLFDVVWMYAEFCCLWKTIFQITMGKNPVEKNSENFQ